MKNKLISRGYGKKGAFLTGLVFACFTVLNGCSAARVAIRKNYDFSGIKRVGVMTFDTSQVQYLPQYSPGNAVADEFVLQLLDMGADVVERSQIENVLKEHNLWKSGQIDPASIREVGKILGVDALVMGTVTRYIPDSKNRIYIKDAAGNTREQVFLVDAEIGINARMVDVVTGEVIWAGSYTYDSFYMDSAINQAVGAILDSLRKIWSSKG